MIKKKYLYVIIIILVLCILGVINIPLLQNNNLCNSENQSKMYFKFGIVSIPLKFNVCNQE